MLSVNMHRSSVFLIVTTKKFTSAFQNEFVVAGAVAKFLSVMVEKFSQVLYYLFN